MRAAWVISVVNMRVSVVGNHEFYLPVVLDKKTARTRIVTIYDALSPPIEPREWPRLRTIAPLIKGTHLGKISAPFLLHPRRIIHHTARPTKCQSRSVFTLCAATLLPGTNG